MKTYGEIILIRVLMQITTNKLLTQWLEYYKLLAMNTNVTKAELAKVFGVSISDLVAVSAKMINQR